MGLQNALSPSPLVSPSTAMPAYDWCNGTLAGALEHVTQWHADDEAIVYHNTRLSYREFSAAVARAADGLAGLGVRAGHLIGVLHANHPHVQILQFAVARLGATFVPFNVALSPADLSQLVAHSDVGFLIVGGAYRGRPLRDALLEAMAGLSLPQREDITAGLALASHPALQVIVDLGQDMSVLEQAARGAVARYAGTTAEDISHIVYTSGSTRFPKGARLRHRGMLGGGFYWGEAFGLESADRVLVTLPFFHTGGLVLSGLSALLRGACIHIIDQFDECEVIEIVQRERITTLGLLDYQLRRVAELAATGRYDISSWTKGHTQAASYALRRELGLQRIVGFYAMTEASNPAALVMAEEQRESIRSSANGRPLPGVELRIVDPETGALLGPMERGEIRFRGWNRFAGYHRPAPEDMPNRVFDSGGFFCTGDCGYLDADGYLYLTGRYKDMIKSGGENVSALEVEDWLVNQIEIVEAAKIVGVPDERWGEAVVAFIELSEGKCARAQDIIDACKGRLSAWKIPKHVFFLKAHEWPISSTEMIKVRKEDLRARALLLVQ